MIQIRSKIHVGQVITRTLCLRLSMSKLQINQPREGIRTFSIQIKAAAAMGHSAIIVVRMIYICVFACICYALEVYIINIE